MRARQAEGMGTGRQGPGFKVGLAVALVVLSALAVLVVLVYRFFMNLAPDTARLWALIATAALLPVAWLFWWLGATEARGVLRGLDQGVDKVFGAASSAIDMKVTATRRIKEAARDPAPFVVLPPSEPAFTMRHQLTAGDRIELD